MGFSQQCRCVCVCVCVCVFVLANYTTDSCQWPIHMCVTWSVCCVATTSSIPQMIVCCITCCMYRCQLGAPKPSRLLCSLYDINIRIALEVVWLKVFSVTLATQRYKLLHSFLFTFMWPCIVTNFFIIKPTRCNNFTNLFSHETLHVSDSPFVHHQLFIHCTLSNGICHTGL